MVHKGRTVKCNHYVAGSACATGDLSYGCWFHVSNQRYREFYAGPSVPTGKLVLVFSRRARAAVSRGSTAPTVGSGGILGVGPGSAMVACASVGGANMRHMRKWRVKIYGNETHDRKWRVNNIYIYI